LTRLARDSKFAVEKRTLESVSRLRLYVAVELLYFLPVVLLEPSWGGLLNRGGGERWRRHGLAS